MPEAKVKSSLAGEQVAVTGPLASMTHEEAAGLIRACGGRFVPALTSQTTILVVGQERWPLGDDGRPTASLQRARELEQAGRPIRIVSEEDFLELLGLDEKQSAIRRLYSIVQLSRVVGVSGREIRHWIRAGLIRPVRAVHGVAWFDFRQVAFARTLADLVRAGVPARRIRESLDQLARWLPDSLRPPGAASLLEQGGRLLVRLEGGHLAQPDGQLCLEFEGPDGLAGAPRVLQPHEAKTAEEWFQAALAREDEGLLEEAAQAYERALESGGPHAETLFNLGNVLYALERREEAARRFLEAVEVNPAFVEAWNNLGNVLADLGQRKEAVRVFRRALEIEPHYTDAHYNLAEVLHQMGRSKEARAHWRACLKHDPHGVWAEHVRRRLFRREE